MGSVTEHQKQTPSTPPRATDPNIESVLDAVVADDTADTPRTASSEELNETEGRDPLDQVDRSVVVGEGLKSIAMWALRLLIIAAFLYVAWYVLKQVGQGVLPIIFAIIVCTVLAPPTTWMRSKGVPSALAAIISILGFFGFFGTLLWMIAPDIARQSQVLYLQTLEGVQRLQLWAQGPPFNVDGDDLDRFVNDIASWAQDQAGAIAGGIVTGVSTATSIVITLFVVLVLTFFFLKDGFRFLPWMRAVVGRRLGWHLTESLMRGWKTLGGFIRAQATVSFIDAFFIGLGLVLIGVPMALALAVITFIAGFIPYVGAIVAGTLSVMVALVSLGFTEALMVLAVVLAVQQLEGNVLSPWLQARAMNLHPVIVLVSVIIGGGLFGLLGSFLAVPVAAMIAVAFRYLLDITALRSGEKLASDIDFVTHEGQLAGRLTEEEGRLMRKQWRNSVVYVDEELEDDVATSPTPPSQPRRFGRTILTNSRIEHLFGRFGRR